MTFGQERLRFSEEAGISIGSWDDISTKKSNTHRVAAKFVQDQFCGKNEMTVSPRPPYFLDLIPCDFSLLSKLKIGPKGRSSDTIGGLKTDS